MLHRLILVVLLEHTMSEETAADSNHQAQEQIQPSTSDGQPQHSQIHRDKVALAQDAAEQQIMRRLLNQKTQGKPAAFYLLVCSDELSPKLHKFDVVEDLIAAFNRLEKSHVFAFAFMGHHLPVSVPPHRYLITPMGPLPMFTPPSVDNLQIDTAAYLGDTSDEHAMSEAVAEFEATRPAVNNNHEKEEDNGEEDELSVH